MSMDVEYCIPDYFLLQVECLSLASPGKPWQALASPGKPWQARESSGKPWQDLASPDKPWQAKVFVPDDYIRVIIL